ncbi:MAG TPA: metal-dependent hydrolase [Longimicrobiales bacterium]
MDPLTHTLTGAGLSRAGLNRATPLATAALVLAANAPDVDILVYAFGGEYAGLAYRRGWTHGPLAWAVVPFLVAGAVLAWDRWVRRRRAPDSPPARPGPLLLTALLGVLTHPVLDWMNTYGIRLLMPFDRRWFYGDALFIIDPWVWLLLGGAVFLSGERTVAGVVGWTLLAALTTALVVVAPIAAAAKWVWIGGVAALAALGFLQRARYARAHRHTAAERGAAARPGFHTRVARWGVAAAALYIALMVAGDLVAGRRVRDALAERGIAPVRAVMVAPDPANPFTGSVVAATPTAYRFGAFHWLGRPQLRLRPDSLPIRPTGMDAVIAAAAGTEAARNFLSWSRFPFFAVESRPDGWTVRIGDARYADTPGAGGLAGLVVRLDRHLRPLR